VVLLYLALRSETDDQVTLQTELTLRMIFVSLIVGTLPVQRANLHWSPSMCSVTPISAICNTNGKLSETCEIKSMHPAGVKQSRR